MSLYAQQVGQQSIHSAVGLGIRMGMKKRGTTEESERLTRAGSFEQGRSIGEWLPASRPAKRLILPKDGRGTRSQ